MNFNYKLLQTIHRPAHAADGGTTTLHIYDVSDETYGFLLMLRSFEEDGAFHGDRYYPPEVWETGTLRNAVMADLEIDEPGISLPGAPTYRYEFSLIGGCLVVAEFFFYNI